MLQTVFCEDAKLWGMVVTLARLEETMNGWFRSLGQWMDEGTELESKEAFQAGGRLYKLTLTYPRTGEKACIRFRDGNFSGAYVRTEDDYIVHVRPR